MPFDTNHLMILRLILISGLMKRKACYLVILLFLMLLLTRGFNVKHVFKFQNGRKNVIAMTTSSSASTPETIRFATAY